VNETRFRYWVLALLFGILICHVVQLVRIPSVRSNVWVSGGSLDVNVENHLLDVNVENSTLDVNVENSTLDVEVTNRKPIDVNVKR
jgi:hypothetical protein